ncbi:MAG: (Fe-S)-binding protein [Bacteroidota bacterium]|jgi:glycolate oxidase iron-sulfur subunit
MIERKKKPAFEGINIPSDELLNNCIHCGLCLPTCPTYSLTELERSSPRGRIRLIKAVAEGTLSITKEFVYEMNFCLDCQACETACPAGIKYGSLVEAARAQIYELGFENILEHYPKRFLLNWVFSRNNRIKFLARLLRLYQLTGLQLVVEKTGILKLFSKDLHCIQLLAPKISKSFSTDILDEQISPKTKVRYRVGFLPGCIMDVAFAQINIDTVELLLHHGCEVIIPKGQRCCGSLQGHNGDIRGAKENARYNIELFSHYKFDYLVINSAGCGAFIKEYGSLFQDDGELVRKAKSLSDRTKDITEFLVETGFYPVRKKEFDPYHGKRVTYQDACHLVHTQRISEQPRILIRSVPNIEYVELPESSWCCGSAGIYNITQHTESMQLLKRKIERIQEIKPDIVVTGNPGCMLQLQYGLNKEKLDIELLHTATFLRRACET